MKTTTYTDTQKKTLAFLRTGKTVLQIAQRFEISRFAAYERIDGLKAKKAIKAAGKATGPEGKRGPKAKVWVAAPN